jgi:hypothetical protein
MEAPTPPHVEWFLITFEWLKIKRNLLHHSSSMLKHSKRRRHHHPPECRIPHKFSRTHPRLNIFPVYFAVALLMLLILYRHRLTHTPRWCGLSLPHTLCFAGEVHPHAENLCTIFVLFTFIDDPFRRVKCRR